MTRNELIDILANVDDTAICMKNDNSCDYNCCDCAEKCLADYEQKIRTDTIDEFFNALGNEFIWILNTNAIFNATREDIYNMIFLSVKDVQEKLKEQKICYNCNNLMFSDCYGECVFGGIVNPHDTCEKWERKIKTKLK